MVPQRLEKVFETACAAEGAKSLQNRWDVTVCPNIVAQIGQHIKHTWPTIASTGNGRRGLSARAPRGRASALERGGTCESMVRARVHVMSIEGVAGMHGSLPGLAAGRFGVIMFFSACRLPSFAPEDPPSHASENQITTGSLSLSRVSRANREIIIMISPLARATARARVCARVKTL